MAWSDQELAGVVAADLPGGTVVNLGIGLPLAVADHIAAEQNVTLHSENGIFAMWRAALPGEEDRDLVNAGKQHVVLEPGAAITDQVDSFALVRAGYLDIAILGAYQVSAIGDLANWKRPADAIAGVGGAVDIALGAGAVWVMMHAQTREGRSKLVERCSFPLTAVGVVTRVYTELGVLERDPEQERLTVRRLAPDVTIEELAASLEVPTLRGAALAGMRGRTL